MRTSVRKQTLRPFLSRLHRYVGLTLAAFLVVSGITGALISFNHELDEWLNPKFFHAEGGAPVLTASRMVERIEQRDPQARVGFMTLNPEPGHAVTAFVDPRVDPDTGELYPLDYNQVFIDPASGEFLGQRSPRICPIRWTCPIRRWSTRSFTTTGGTTSSRSTDNLFDEEYVSTCDGAPVTTVLPARSSGAFAIDGNFIWRRWTRYVTAGGDRNPVALYHPTIGQRS